MFSHANLSFSHADYFFMLIVFCHADLAFPSAADFQFADDADSFSCFFLLPFYSFTFLLFYLFTLFLFYPFTFLPFYFYPPFFSCMICFLENLCSFMKKNERKTCSYNIFYYFCSQIHKTLNN